MSKRNYEKNLSITGKDGPISSHGESNFSNALQENSSPSECPFDENLSDDSRQNALHAEEKTSPKNNRGKFLIAFPAKKVATLSVFTALSLIMFLIENLFPSMIIPGARMGLANIFSFFALILYGPIEAFLVVIARTLLGAVFAGNFSVLLYSFTGGMVAMTISCLLMKFVYPKLSLLCVSIVAAVCHNITQNAVYVLLNNTPSLFSLLPYLSLMGILSGLIVGGVTMLLFKKIPINVFEKALFKS